MVIVFSSFAILGLFAWRNSGGIWMVWRNAGGICERKTLFRMKKEADQAGFKGTRTGPSMSVGEQRERGKQRRHRLL